MDENYIKYAQMRLDGIKENMDDIASLKLEVKPPKVPMEKLIKFEYIQVGQDVYSKDNQKIGIIESNGYINDGEDTLSIHKMSAKHLGLSNNNGWDYFWVKNDQDELIKLDSLRYEFQENEL